MRYKQTIKIRHGTVTLVYLIFDLYCCEYPPPPHHSQENAWRLFLLAGVVFHISFQM